MVFFGCEGQERQILARVLADELGREFLPVVELEGDFRGVAGDVVVGDHVVQVAVAADDDSRPEAARTELPFLALAFVPRLTEEELPGDPVELRRLLPPDLHGVHFNREFQRILRDGAEGRLEGFGDLERVGRHETGRLFGADRILSGGCRAGERQEGQGKAEKGSEKH